MKRFTTVVLPILVTAFGVASLHFCEGSSFEHHREWAVSNGFPEPSFAVWLVGTIATVIGALWFGVSIGRRASVNQAMTS